MSDLRRMVSKESASGGRSSCSTFLAISSAPVEGKVGRASISAGENPRRSSEGDDMVERGFRIHNMKASVGTLQQDRIIFFFSS
jgi:hypothetical protein